MQTPHPSSLRADTFSRKGRRKAGNGRRPGGAGPDTHADRCDRCGAQAFVRAVFPGGGDLLFCGHHGRAYNDALKSQALDIDDQTSKINKEASTAAY